MDVKVLYITILLLLLALPVLFLFLPRLSGGLMRPAVQRQLRALLNNEKTPTSQLRSSEGIDEKRDILAKLSKSGNGRQRTPSATISLSKRLKYAGWQISPVTFHCLEFLVSVLCYLCVSSSVGFILHISTLAVGPLLLRAILNFTIQKKFKKFDADYPQFLLSTVGLLKTGLTPVGALEAAAKGLESHSLVRAEVNFLVERMRLGLPEDRSIGVFGETIYHPEIELFIQALLLSRRVGGTLSDTLERLARQARKRQYFRNSANAAVGLQRASIWVILAILVSIELYIYATYPILITDAVYDPVGWTVWQIAIVMICIAFLWSKKVTDIQI